MELLTVAQKHLLKHVKSFLSHRRIELTTEALRKLSGPFSESHPEWYVLLEVGGYQLYFYSDGHSQIQKDGEIVADLEIEDFSNLQELEAALFDKLTETFGHYKE